MTNPVIPEIPRYSGKVVILGFGQVARCLAQIVGEELVDNNQVIVVDRAAPDEMVGEFVARGWQYHQIELTRQNADETLRVIASPGDLVINLTAGVCSATIIEITTAIGCLYVDTSIEPWEDEYDGLAWPVEERGSFGFLCRLRERVGHIAKGSPTTVVTHGANPGLVNHFVKHGLDLLCQKRGLERPAANGGSAHWAAVCQQLDIPVIHISEQDTQAPREPRRSGTFLNTWAVEAFWAESMCPGEAGWGSHETELPSGAYKYCYGGRSGVWLEGNATNWKLLSWAPNAGEFSGAAIPHPECLTLTEYLTTSENAARVHAPTVVFVYQACPAAEQSLAESIADDWKLQPDQRVMTGEILSGIDELGVLIIPREPPAIWVGSQLSIDRTRHYAPKSNATVLQVAAGVMAACRWAIQNPAEGYREPEDLPHDFVIDCVRQFIEPFVEVETDWPYRSKISEGEGAFTFMRFSAARPA